MSSEAPTPTPAPSAHTRRSVYSDAAALALLALAACAMTALIIRRSFHQGRLSLPATFDDVTYMLDAARRVQDLSEHGPGALIRGYLAHPPHAPYSSAMAFWGFLVFGINDWAPYAANALLLFLILGLAWHRAGLLPPVQRWFCVTAAACVPFCTMAVFQFRPDLASAVLTAAAIFVLLEPAAGAVSARCALLAGACFGAALLAKPPSFPATLAAFGAASGLRWILDLRATRAASWPRRAARALLAPLLAGTALAVVAGPHFLIDGRSVWNYVHFNMFGIGRAFWATELPVSEHLLYYLSGDGGTFMLGPLAWPLLILAIVPAAAATWRRSERTGPEWSLLIMLAVLLAVSVAAPVKHRYFGAPFHAMLLLSGVAGLARLARILQEQPRRWVRVAGIAAPVLAAALSLFAFRWPAWPPANSPHSVAIRQVAADLNAALRIAAADRPRRVMLTFTGTINGPMLEWLALREGRSLETRSAEAARALNDYNFLLFRWNADLAVACDSKTGLTAGNFPSVALQDDIRRYLDQSRDWEKTATVQRPGGAAGAFYVYRRIGSSDTPIRAR